MSALALQASGLKAPVELVLLRPAATRAPTSACALPGERFQTVTATPRRTKARANGDPINPSPRKLSSVIRSPDVAQASACACHGLEASTIGEPFPDR